MKKTLKIKKMLIVDGYNVLRCGEAYTNLSGEAPNFRDWQDEAFNQARTALLNDLTFYVGKDMRAVVVFDGQRNAHSTNAPQTFGHIKIVFTHNGTSADATIEKLAAHASEQGLQTTVVTSDAAIQNTVMRHGVIRMSSTEFCRTAARANPEVAEDLKMPEMPGKHITQSATIKTRVSIDTLEKLTELRDNLLYE